VNLGGIATTVSGTSFFDERIDYLFAMNIPTSKIPGAATQIISGLISQANAKGASLSMGETVRLNVKMTGTVSKPIISTDMKESVGNAKKALEDQLKMEFEKQKKELEEKAKAEADRYKKEAEDKAKAEMDKAKKAAEEKAKAEQDRLKKEAEKKAKDALKKVFK
jgi:vacuolar-type H+-ATPase subunit H